MRVVSLVPSLTETLLACGVEVIGRTRYCIHPADEVADIAVVGGTKDANWQRIEDLKPDLVILDREENTLEMAEACPVRWHATHVTSVQGVGAELRALADEIGCTALHDLGESWDELARMPVPAQPIWRQLPGLVKTIGDALDFKRVEYLIWQNPWMAVSRRTFIGSMLERTGLGELLPAYDKSYPELPETLPRADTFYLLSSEPYPFERYLDELEAAGFNGALVDGEFYSWFGIRSYNKLKTYLDESRNLQ